MSPDSYGNSEPVGLSQEPRSELEGWKANRAVANEKKRRSLVRLLFYRERDALRKVCEI
jgi:hypothetical protein